MPQPTRPFTLLHERLASEEFPRSAVNGASRPTLVTIYKKEGTLKCKSIAFIYRPFVSIRTSQITRAAIRYNPASYLIESHSFGAALYKTQLTLAAASVFLRILIGGIVETRGKSQSRERQGEVSVSAEAARVEKG